MSKAPKILLASPTSKEKEYVIFDWISHIKKLHYPVDILLSDNSKTDHFSRRLRKKIPVIHISDIYSNSAKRICKSLNVLRNYFLMHDYDYFFSLECDIFPPLDIIEKLLASNKQAVAALYFLREGAESTLMLQQIEPYGFKPYDTKNLNTNESFFVCDGTLKKIYHAGLGCILLKREVIEKIPFRIGDKEDIQSSQGFISKSYPDTFFAKDCFVKKIDIYADTSIICKHKNKYWTLEMFK